MLVPLPFGHLCARCCGGCRGRRRLATAAAAGVGPADDGGGLGPQGVAVVLREGHLEERVGVADELVDVPLPCRCEGILKRLIGSSVFQIFDNLWRICYQLTTWERSGGRSQMVALVRRWHFNRQKPGQ